MFLAKLQTLKQKHLNLQLKSGNVGWLNKKTLKPVSLSSYIYNFLYTVTSISQHFLNRYSENVVVLQSKQKLRVCSKVKIIGHVPYINILAGLRGLRDKLLYLVLLSLYPSPFWELRYKRNFKNLQF